MIGSGVNLGNIIDPINGGADVNQQSSTAPIFQFYLQQVLKVDISLTAPVSVDDDIIAVSAGHGFIVGNLLTLWGGEFFEQLEVKLVTDNNITVEMPVANTYAIEGSIITRGIKNLALNGAVTPITALYKPLSGSVPVDLSGANLTLYSGQSGDDGKFGGGPALTKGVYFREEDGDRINLGNFKDNGTFRHRGALVEYTNKGPAGTNSTTIQVDFVKTFGQVFRIDPRVPDFICMKIRDNILADNSSFIVSLVGSYTQGE